MPTISIVIPVFGCNSSLDELHDRLHRVLRSLAPAYEIVFVDDRSTDGAWSTLMRLADANSRVTAIRLSRNFGQHAAITAGLAHSRGEWVVVMDCDLQDPPEEIPRLFLEAQGGVQIVYGCRKNKKHSLFRRTAAGIFFALLNASTGYKLERERGSFSVISRKVVDAFLRLNDQNRHYLFVLDWLGFSSHEVDYEHQERKSGVSAYPLRALLRHALSGVLFQTTFVLRWIIYVGFWISLTGVGLASYLIYHYIVHAPMEGWTSLAVLILLIGGFIIMSTGVAGLYMGKIFEQVKGRPLYVVDEVRSASAAPTP